MKWDLDDRTGEVPFGWFRWTRYWPNGKPVIRGFEWRVWRFGMALGWDGAGKFHKTRLPDQLTQNYGRVRFTIFWVDDFQLYLESL